MPEIIAGTYELLEKIGSGGGGIVYLGRHLRLEKPVVLKADKRTLSARPEVLRREVDALKKLNHTYIPQVYDFIVENDTAYTVMDYIEGESLDKALKRGERFSQPQVIEWAVELLEALCYLHSRPPHGILHSDIKPANVMRTPQGDIRLIDFNIALALGESGTVRVGYSRGYASPEHYGADSFARGVPVPKSTADGTTELLSSERTERLPTAGRVRPSTFSNRSHRASGLLDVRSDIYSLGATLYHILSGQRPAQDAGDVVPLAQPGISPAIAEIIRKAMEVNPDDRYQTAQEMLDAFCRLHENDRRSVRHRRQIAVTAAVLTAAFLTGAASAMLGLRQMEQTQAQQAVAARTDADAAKRAETAAREAESTARAAEEAERIAQQALAAVTEAEAALQRGDAQRAAALALQALEPDTAYRAQAQCTLSEALGVYDLADGFKACQLLPLESEPIKLVCAPDGSRAAALLQGQIEVFDLATGAQLAQLPLETSALADAVFLDEHTLIYAAPGSLQAYDIERQAVLWQTDQLATSIVLSEDKSTVATVYRDASQAVIYNAADGSVQKTVDFAGRKQHVPTNDIFGDTGDNLLAFDRTGRHLAVSFSDGTVAVYDLENSENDFELALSAYTHFEGGFSNGYFTVAASGNGDSLFLAVDLNTVQETGSLAANELLHMRTDESGVYLSAGNVLVQIDPVTGEQREAAFVGAEITAFDENGSYFLVTDQNGRIYCFDTNANLVQTIEDDARLDFAQLCGEYAVLANRDTPELRVLQLERHPDAQLLTYDGAYAHDEARISSKGETAMLFRYDSFRIYDCASGNVLAETAIPEAEQIYDQQFSRDGQESRLEVIYYNGRIRTYSALDGRLLRETQGEAPDSSLREEFRTAHWRITSPLHGTPEAYDLETGARIRTLEEKDYLTYVTQVGAYVITEYISAEGERYGLLLNPDGETLARLPGLCDILEDGTLVFDDFRGNLRTSKIYGLDELREIADARWMENA